MAAWPSIEPVRPRSDWVLASLISLCRRNRRNSKATKMIMMGPPTNSPRVNCQPSSSAMMMPISITRFVEAISNTIAATKLAPLRNSERANATDA